MKRRIACWAEIPRFVAEMADTAHDKDAFLTDVLQTTCFGTGFGTMRRGLSRPTSTKYPCLLGNELLSPNHHSHASGIRLSATVDDRIVALGMDSTIADPDHGLSGGAGRGPESLQLLPSSH